MKFPPFPKSKSDAGRPLTEILDLFQDAFAEFVRRINETFITSDRVARRQVAFFKDTQWIAANTALVEMPIFVCPYDLEVVSFTWCGQDAIAVSTSDYRTMTLGRYRDGVAAGTVATRNTGSNGNAIAAFTPWALVLGSDINVLRCQAGDVLTIAMPETGTGPAVNEGSFTLDYELLREVENA